MKSEQLLKELHETRATIKFLQHQTAVLGKKARKLGQEVLQAQQDEAQARRQERQENKEKSFNFVQELEVLFNKYKEAKKEN